MLVYVIRHGQSENNLSRLWTGWYDTPLTDQGRKDAQTAQEYLKNVSFDKVYSSDLCRAMETARIALPNVSFETTPLLREINVGSLMMHPISILSAEEMQYAELHGYAQYGGESKPQFQERIRQMMTLLETLDAHTVAMFSHAGFLRNMMDIVLEIHLPHQHLRCNNCTIAIFDYTNSNWQLHSWINLS